MSNNAKKYLSYILLFVAFALVPQILLGFYTFYISDKFYERLDAKFDDCIRDVEKTNLSKEICIQSRDNSAKAFSFAAQIYTPVVAVCGTMIFALSIGLIGLKRQIDEVKERINV